ncbi:hypothetical protein B0I08_102330 [Glaciihabitans tibetensis]|uniref:Mycothiol maleylpyruvate isomerase-like protein n=1 Tax=Glaciihabitans tibetensis TaxID=1266600 RepID=A0A2T0VHV7_9MICO|nr:hypothetical protein [Glaciihabitans tibetensis]PRY69653.1 hypothetical protein B0I08_102330 [Glaciihabitans tibetensis]
MSDAAKYLPLSHRDREDESTVTNDWSPHLRTCLEALAVLVESLPPEQLESPSWREQYRVIDVLSHLLWRLGTSRAERARQLVAVALRSRSALAGGRVGGGPGAGGPLAGATLTHCRALAGSANRSPAALADQLRAAAVANAGARPGAEPGARTGAGKTRRSVADLSVAVVDSLDVARTAGKALTLDPVATGAVALARSLSAPVPIRAVLRDCLLHATDAGWSVGRGSTRNSSAGSIILFLWGRGDIPPAGLT